MDTNISKDKTANKWRFILSRTDDYEKRSIMWIIVYAFLFWLATRIIAACLIGVCIAIYNSFGVNPQDLTSFGGDPTTLTSSRSMVLSLMTLIIIVPLLEECIFRLGLSFKKWQVGIALACIPVALIWNNYNHLPIWCSIALGVIALAVYLAVLFSVTQNKLDMLQNRYLVSSVWLTSIAFGLIHLFAFSNYSIVLLPYMLCMTLVPFFAGCSIAYLRVNLGFGYGLGMHIFNNLPAVAMALLS